MGETYPNGPIKGGFLQVRKKKNSAPSIRTSGMSQMSGDRMSASVRIPGVSARKLAEGGMHLCELLALESGLDHAMPNLAVSPFCPAIPADSEQQAASISCFR